MKSINEVIEQNINGLHYGSRIILPFCSYVFKADIVKKSITDSEKNLVYFTNYSYEIYENFTEVCFPEYDNLFDNLSEDDFIDLIVVEKGKDVFQQENRINISIKLKENNIITVHSK